MIPKNSWNLMIREPGCQSIELMLLLFSEEEYLVTIINQETRYVRENKLVDACIVGAI